MAYFIQMYSLVVSENEFSVTTSWLVAKRIYGTMKANQIIFMLSVKR
jgi:hypothetical protein